MFSHAKVWAAIDALAHAEGLSVSKLARNAGLDPTTFNKSKRVSADGRLRWPSTESLSKILQATGTDTTRFMALIGDSGSNAVPPAGYANAYAQPDTGEVMAGAQFGFAEGAPSGFTGPRAVPLLGIAQAGSGGFFDEAGLPTGEGWDAVEFPHAGDESVYALEISGDSMMPLYRDGDRIIVSPGSSVRRGDRVVVRTRDGEVMAKVLARQTAKSLELQSLNPEHEDRHFDLSQIDWIARIVWASQ